MNQKPGKQPVKILVIDDEEAICRLIKQALTSRGYAVVTAGDGAEGLALLRNDTFRLAITDVKMPNMDGLEFLEAAKSIDPSIEVIIVTGYGTVGLAVDAIRKGACDLLQKPVNLDVLYAAVDKAVEKSELKALVSIYESSAPLFSAIRLSDLMPILVDLSLKVLKADDISIMLLNNDGAPEMAASHGLRNGHEEQLRLLLAQELLGRLKGDPGSMLITGAVEKDPAVSERQGVRRIKSSLLCPLAAGERVLGVLCAARTESEAPFKHGDKQYVALFASHISRAIENAQRYRELEERAVEQRAGQPKEAPGRDETLSGIAHQMNNALGIIIGLSEFLIDGEGMNEENLRDLQAIKSQAEKCVKMVVNLSEYRRKLEQRTH